MVLSRVLEVAWGVTVGVATVWLVNEGEKRIAEQRH
jgi:hypothetical protein